MKKYGQYGETQGSQSATLLLAVVNGYQVVRSIVQKNSQSPEHNRLRR